MKKFFKKTSIAFIAIVVLMVGMGLILPETDYYKAVEASEKLIAGIYYIDLQMVSDIVDQCPDSINTLPSMDPWWWQLITEQPVICYPLQVACIWQNYDIIKLFIDNGADCNLAWKGYQSSRTPLMMAVCHNYEVRTDIITLLLESGADKSLKDKTNMTAYDYAVLKGDMEIAELLKP